MSRAALLAGVVLLAPAASSTEAQVPPPIPSEPGTPSAPFERFELENGLEVIVAERENQAVVSVGLYTRGGASIVDPRKAGLAGLAATLLTRGTSTRSASAIAEAIEGVGGAIEASAGRDAFSVHAVVPPEHLELAFALLADGVRDANFPEEELERARRQALVALEFELGQPRTIAARAFASALYGDHPYGAASTVASIREVDREDLLAFRETALRPGGTLLVVAGTVRTDEVERRVREHFGDWSGGPPPPPAFPSLPERDGSRIVLVHRPGSVQSVIQVGHAALLPDHPDHFPLAVLNRILGGGADARLFRILRDERGWSSAAGSSVTRPADRGAFSVIAEVRAEVTDSATVEILRQLHRLREEPVLQGELDAARESLAGSLSFPLESADPFARQLATVLLLGLPPEAVSEYPHRIRAVTPEDVQRAAREHLHPDRALIVVVGDASRILGPLEAVAPVDLVGVGGTALARSEVLGAGGPGADPAAYGDPSVLREGLRRYEYLLRGVPSGTAEYQLERDGDAWVSTVSVSVAGSVQETELRFGAEDFAPRSLRQTRSQGSTAIAVELRVEDGRLRGQVELPASLGGARAYDEPLPPGTLLPGMDDYALAIASLEEGTRIRIPYVDVTRGETVHLEARVSGAETLDLGPHRRHEVWRVEVTGGPAPILLYLDRDAPHHVVRQEFVGQPVRLERLGGG